MKLFIVSSKEEKKNKIIEEAINLLKNEGSAGLTMRKLASAAGMTLSNLQYYFPGRSDVLEASINYFFLWCEKNIINETERIVATSINPSEDFVDLILNLLIVNDPNDPTNIIFKELCALAVHDEALAKSFEEHYKSYIKSLIVISSGLMHNSEKVIYLLIPFAEGYSLMGTSIPVERNEIIKMLKSLIQEIIKED